MADALTITRDPPASSGMAITRDPPVAAPVKITRDPAPARSALPSNRAGFDRTAVRASPTGLAGAVHRFGEDMRPALDRANALRRRQETEPFNPLNIVRDTAENVGALYDIGSAAVGGTLGRLVDNSDNNITGYGAEHRKAIGDAAMLVAPVEAPLGLAAKGAKLAGRAGREALESAAAGLSRARPATSVASKIVRDAPRPNLSPGRTARSLPAIERDEPVLHGPDQHGAMPIVGDEANPVERVDNALFRLGGHHTASQIEAKQYLDALPAEVKDPARQEQLTHVLERRLINPKASIPANLRSAWQAVEPWVDRQRAVVNRLRARTDPEVENYLAGQGYVPRYAKGKSPTFDLRLPGETQRSTLAGKSSLGTTSKSLKSRQFFVATDADGKSVFLEGRPVETDIKDRPWANVRQATVKEVEANTDVRYHKNALVNFVQRTLEDEKVERNLDVLDEIKKGLKDEGLAFQSEWRYRDPKTGQTIVKRANDRAPDHFVELPHIPQLRGWSFDPKIAEAIKDYRPAPEEPIGDVVSRVNRMLTASMFATPFPHIANVGSMWTVGRGWDWMNPGAYPRMMKAGSKAINEVLKFGPDYKRMLREGSALRAGDDATRNFYDVLLRAAGHDIETSPQTWRALGEAFKVGNMTPKDVVKLIYDTSHKVLWSVNDMLLLQRQFELQAKGMSERQAIKEAEKWIANYRVPPQVMGSRSMTNLLTKNHFITFGRYEYGKWRALGEMAKPFIKGDKAGSADALGKMLVLGIMMGFGYPMMDHIAQGVTGNENARLHRGGEATMVDAGVQYAKGEKDWASAMASMLTPAPGVKAGAEILSNRQLYNGRPIIEPESSTAGKIAQGAEYGSQFFMPGEAAIRGLSDGGSLQELGALAGVSLPRRDPAIGRAKGKKFNRREARSREKRDDLTRTLKDVGL